jgi:hypothetical protein
VTVNRFTVPVESAHVLQFARACGYEDGPRNTPTPTFLVAADTFDPEFDRRPRSDRPWFGPDDGREQKGASGFHASTEFDFVRPLVVGEVLHAEQRVGEVHTREGSRGGTLTFTPTITEFFDDAGDLVACLTWTNVTTSKEVVR